MTKILILGSGSSNKGAAAMLIGTCKNLRKFIPDVEFTMLSRDPVPDSALCNEYTIRVVDNRVNPFLALLEGPIRLVRCAVWRILHKHFDLNANVLIDEKILREYMNTDIVVDLSGDTISDDYGVLSTVLKCFTILSVVFLEKPFVIYPQSIGPFQTKPTKLLARFTLNKVNLIIAREEITMEYLQTSGINKPSMYLTADMAFLLDPAPREIVEELMLKENINIKNRPIIGISVNELMNRFLRSKNLKSEYNEYVRLMVQTVDYLTDKLDAIVLFVPHVIAPYGDDRILAEKICQMLKNRHKTVSITTDYTPDKLKGIIGQCDLFIGARMHANIAALSQCVPTITIAYSHKTYGIMKMLGQERYVCDIVTVTFDELRSKINDAWENREKIKEELEMKIPMVKERAMLNGKLVKELLDSLNRNGGN